MSLQPADFFYPETEQLKPRIAISACLAGEAVRYDGASTPLQDSRFFQQHFQLNTLCPEVGAGLSVPRPPVQLVLSRQGVRALGREDPGIDVSQALFDYREKSLDRLKQLAICGYIFKSRSPSCGLASTPLFDQHGTQQGLASGLQASHIQQHMPWLVLREETDLKDKQSRQQFLWLCRVSSEYQRASDAHQLADFHRHYQTVFPALPDSLTVSASDYRQQLIKVIQRFR